MTVESDDRPLRYSLAEAAKALKIGESTVRLRINQGHLNVVRDGGRTFIHRDELERYAREGAVA